MSCAIVSMARPEGEEMRDEDGREDVREVVTPGRGW